MASTPAALLTRLAQLGMRVTTVDHPPVATVDANKALRGALPGGHTKNLFLKDKKGGLWLVVALEDRPVDLKELRRRLAAPPLSFARPEVLRDALGVEPGAVTPFAVINDDRGLVRVVLDAAMLAIDPLNFHPLVNTRTTAIAAADLLRFLDEMRHPPLVLDMDAGLPTPPAAAARP
ncbi:MAG: prolyl-tRNA synthetase associated domain-containing protein [Rhodospirillales bacterium]